MSEVVASLYHCELAFRQDLEDLRVAYSEQRETCQKEKERKKTKNSDTLSHACLFPLVVIYSQVVFD
jgi:hypothetical protein